MSFMNKVTEGLKSFQASNPTGIVTRETMQEVLEQAKRTAKRKFDQVTE
jgi:hypothetical protein